MTLVAKVSYLVVSTYFNYVDCQGETDFFLHGGRMLKQQQPGMGITDKMRVLICECGVHIQALLHHI